MNIFYLDRSPIEAAKMHCDKHVPKMIVECYQMMGSSVIRHGATPDMMPLTKKQTPLKGGYHNHPSTRWTGESRTNYLYVSYMAAMLCDEYTKRFGKRHFCEDGIEHLFGMSSMIPDGPMTAPAQCMPDEFKDDDPVVAYRRYYHSKTFAAWNKGREAPAWWNGAEVAH